jgi:hypothetical protein
MELDLSWRATPSVGPRAYFWANGRSKIEIGIGYVLAGKASIWGRTNGFATTIQIGGT